VTRGKGTPRPHPLLAALLVAGGLLGACELEQTEWLPPPDDPAMLKTSDVDGGTNPCPSPSPVWCFPGYLMETSNDGKKVYCFHQNGCPVLQNPCKMGDPVTYTPDGEVYTLCKGIHP
jgi:hypothetical protein